MNIPDKQKRLHKFFKKKAVADIAELCSALDTNSRMTVFRHLRREGYLSSYSHAGRYYTLLKVPTFDEHGLWYYEEIGFSKAGTLKATICMLIERSSAGYTHGELRALLRVRVQNTLNDLVVKELVDREYVGKIFVYVSNDKEKADLQLRRRQELIGQETGSFDLEPVIIIEILVELLRTETEQWEPKQISKRLHSRRIKVSEQDIAKILERYRLKKKPRNNRQDTS